MVGGTDGNEGGEEGEEEDEEEDEGDGEESEASWGSAGGIYQPQGEGRLFSDAEFFQFCGSPERAR